MKIVMIGMPNCTHCREIIPKVEEYCRAKDIQYMYTDIRDLSSEEMAMLRENGAASAPAFIVYEGIEHKVYVQEEILKILK